MLANSTVAQTIAASLIRPVSRIIDCEPRQKAGGGGPDSHEVPRRSLPPSPSGAGRRVSLMYLGEIATADAFPEPKFLKARTGVAAPLGSNASDRKCNDVLHAEQDGATTWTKKYPRRRRI